MRTKPSGSTCKRKRRINSFAGSVMVFRVVAVSSVSIGIGNVAIVNIDNPLIRYSYSVGIPADVLKHLLRTGKRFFTIDNPVFLPYSVNKEQELFFMGKQGDCPREDKLSFQKSFYEVFGKLRSEDY